MRRNLTISFIILIAMVAMVQTVNADTTSWGSGMSLTEKEATASLGSRIDAVWCDTKVLGSWFSSSNVLPQIVVDGPSYFAYGDFSGIDRVEKVELSPDHGKTVWKAKLIPGKGYQVELPNLAVGSYALEWGVSSRDKRNRVILLIIPINWNSHRETSALNHLMVQSAPIGSETFDLQRWFACLRGFVSSEATLDMGYLQQKAAVAQMSQPQIPQPAPVVQPQPTSESRSESISESDWEQSDGKVVESDEPVGRAVAAEPIKVRMTLIVIGGKKRFSIPMQVPSDCGVGEGTKVTFRNDRGISAEAIVTDLVGTTVYARQRWGKILSGDRVILGGGESR